jgi:hypothetical protein
MLSKRAASKCETSPLSNFQNASADRLVRGAHHRRCAREGLTAAMMPYHPGSCKYTGWRLRPASVIQVIDRLMPPGSIGTSETGPFAKVCYSPFSVISSLKPLSTSGSARSVLLLVPSVCFFKLDYAKHPDASTYKLHFNDHTNIHGCPGVFSPYVLFCGSVRWETY